MSDPLPLSPETRAGRDFLFAVRVHEQPKAAPGAGPHADLATFSFPASIIAIEQEARTLARTEVIAEMRAEVEAMERETAYSLSQYAYQRVLAALSRLGEPHE